MKTYNTPEIEFSNFQKVNVIATSIPINKDQSTTEVGAPSRYDDDDDF